MCRKEERNSANDKRVFKNKKESFIEAEDKQMKTTEEMLNYLKALGEYEQIFFLGTLLHGPMIYCYQLEGMA